MNLFPSESVSSTMKRFDALILLCVIATGYLLEHALEIHDRRHRDDACRSNLKNLATAMEMYSTDATGLYPRTSTKLVPSYLKTLPNCPGAKGRPYSYQSSTMPDAFTLLCPAGRFGYSSYYGLIER